MKKAYDHVPLGVLRRVLQKYGGYGYIPHGFYRGERAVLYSIGNKSSIFPDDEGCALSPVLFVILMDRISRHSQRTESLLTSGLDLCFLLML